MVSIKSDESRKEILRVKKGQTQRNEITDHLNIIKRLHSFINGANPQLSQGKESNFELSRLILYYF